MSNVRQLIIENLASSLNNISKANSYNTDIKKVITGKIFPIEKLPSEWRQAACQLRYVRQTNERESLLADSHGESAIVEYQCFATMSNTTHENMMAFLDDIQAAVGKDPSRGNLCDTAYKVLDTWVSSIDLVGTEEFDELLDPLSEQLKDLEAMLIINVEYFYVPDWLSGN